MNSFYCSELRINLIWNSFRYLNSTDEYIFSEDRNSEKKIIGFEIFSSIYCAF